MPLFTAKCDDSLVVVGDKIALVLVGRGAGMIEEFRTNHRGLFVVLVFTAFVGTATIAAQSPHDADVRELERLETVWNKAHEHGDADALERLWANDMEAAVRKMPILTKADALKFARSGRMKFLSYRTSDIRVRVYDNAPVVTGRLQRTRSLNGQEMSDDWRFTKTYVREAQQWRVVAFHASEAAQPLTISAAVAGFASYPLLLSL